MVFTRIHGQRSYLDSLGLHYYVARWYDPQTAHFVQADTIIPNTEDSMAWDRYAYVNNNPMKYNDPSGHFAWVVVGALVGAGIGYGTQVYKNYKNGMSGAEAWTDVDAKPIVEGALIGAGAVIMAPVVVAAASSTLAGAAVVTGSVGLMEASIVTGTVATGMASVLYGPLSGTVERVSEAVSNVQNLMSPNHVLDELPVRVTPNKKTSGILVANETRYPLTSGWDGPSASMPPGSRGLNIITKSHVEGHATSLMHQMDITNATLYINNPPCSSCNNLLPRMLPGGANLRIIAPNGYDKWFSGIME